jgi:hypothetical protein
MNYAAVAALFVVSVIARLAFAEDPPELLVVPSKATMLVGDTRSFRAVGNDGRMRHDVHWSVSPEHVATLTTDGDEASLQAQEPFSKVVLTAYAGGDSAEASIEIRSGTSLPTGTMKWLVTELPGCKTKKIMPAVPSAGGPDIYVEEACPDGSFVRAIMEDGRELWRRKIDRATAPLPPGLRSKEETQPSQHLNLSAHSICDAISPGMTKDKVSKLAQRAAIFRSMSTSESDTWVIEEHSSPCKILFNSGGTVAKKTKVIITD